MTTTSSGNGASAGEDSGSGDWGWFTPAKPQTDGPADDGAETRDERAGGGDEDERDGARRGGDTPSRTVSAIRPVGAALRARRSVAVETDEGVVAAVRGGTDTEGGTGIGVGTVTANGAGEREATAEEPVHEHPSPEDDIPLPEATAARPLDAPARTAEPVREEPAGHGGEPSAPEPSAPEPSAPEPSAPGTDTPPLSGAPSPEEPSPLETPSTLESQAPSPQAGKPAFVPRPRTAQSSTQPYSQSARPQPQSQSAQPLPQSAGPEAAVAGLPPVSAVEQSPDAAVIRRTLEEIEPSSDAVTAYFYALLFVQYPELRDLFPASMDAQRDRLFRALLTAIRLIDDKDVLHRYLTGLGRGHRKYGTRPEHYPAVGECLMAALAQYAPRTWDDEAEAAWVRAYIEISQIMIDAAAEDEQRAPAWWNAEVVSHEQRTPDIAVVTVRPDQPYPFRAGQYASVETPWWPRVWRHYSFASAPRPDGLLTFHVKAVPAGWVSTALVHRARPGDVLRVGPAAGSMTVDHSSDSGLLCLGGGTGIAPVRALVQDVAEHGRARPVDVFYGARSDHDLYDLETVLQLGQQHNWLTVRPVVADGPAPAHAQALAGQLPDAVRRHGPWTGYDGYLAGPPGMIRSAVDALVGAGIPAHRIRHDALDELVASGD